MASAGPRAADASLKLLRGDPSTPGAIALGPAPDDGDVDTSFLVADDSVLEDGDPFAGTTRACGFFSSAQRSAHRAHPQTSTR